MALINCSECGREISDKASACPNCGCPIENTSVGSESSSQDKIKEINGVTVNIDALIRESSFDKKVMAERLEAITGISAKEAERIANIAFKNRKIMPESMQDEYSIELSKFWKGKAGKFQAYEDRIVFSKLDFFLFIFPKEIREYSVLISDIRGLSVRTPAAINPRLIKGILMLIFGLLLIPTIVIPIFLIPIGIFHIIESSNIILVIDALRLNVNDKEIQIEKSCTTRLNNFIESVNSLQARDSNYILRDKSNQQTMINI